MNPNEHEPVTDGLFADCRDGNHGECLFQWPDPVALTCSCSCHKKSSSITTKELAEWRAIAEARSSSEWIENGTLVLPTHEEADASTVNCEDWVTFKTHRNDADRKFWVIANTALPRLIDEVTRAKGRYAQWFKATTKARGEIKSLRNEVEAGRREIAFYAEKHDSMARSIVTFAAELTALRDENEWRDMESAPRDGTRILLLRGERPVCGEWRMDRGEPYWSHDSERIFGMRNARDCPPTHWRPLPAPPLTTTETEGK